MQLHGVPTPKNTFASIKNWQKLVKSLFWKKNQRETLTYSHLATVWLSNTKCDIFTSLMNSVYTNLDSCVLLEQTICRWTNCQWTKWHVAVKNVTKKLEFLKENIFGTNSFLFLSFYDTTIETIYKHFFACNLQVSVIIDYTASHSKTLGRLVQHLKVRTGA